MIAEEDLHAMQSRHTVLLRKIADGWNQNERHILLTDLERLHDECLRLQQRIAGAQVFLNGHAADTYAGQDIG